MKKKGKSKAGKKAVRKRKKADVAEKDMAEVRKNLSKLVKAEAEHLTQAAIEQGKAGQLPTVKYLLEMAGIFPAGESEQKPPSKDEESLAETLLDRLGIPKEPVIADEYAKEDEEIVMLPAKAEEEEESVPSVGE